MKNGYILRQVNSQFDGSHFKILLDLVTRPGITLGPNYLDKKVLPIVAEEAVKIFKSYKFEGFSDITGLRRFHHLSYKGIALKVQSDYAYPQS